ncbi:extracellular solute-binding protein [Cohnella sp.]|uniref:extracellular solute-binding protein n=1 Tax=Cohnella sp. TaxID=1883426 RepID=UPI0035615D7E
MKLLKAVAMLFLSLSLIVGCSTSNSGGNATKENTSTNNTSTNTGEAPASEPAKNEKKIPITIATQYWSGGKWTDDHATIKYLNEKFNVDIKLQLINGPEYNEKFKVMAASGDLPDIYRSSGAEFLNWSSEGAFADLSGVWAKYPNLNKAFPLDSEAMKLLNPEGKLYGIPSISWIARDTVQIRKDWLDNLGISLPTEDEFTVDKLYEIAKAFATQDPDQNGVNGDTIGMNMNPLVRNAFGIASDWMEKDGKLIPRHTQVEEYKAYLAFLKKAYDEKVLDQDFVLRKGNEVLEMQKGNKIGLYHYHNAYHVLQEDIKKANPSLNPELVPMAPPVGPTGVRGSTAEKTGTLKVVINAKADDEKIDRILQIFDWWVTDEGSSIMKNGIEGVDYTKNADGTYQVTEQWENNQPRYLNSNLFKRPGTDFIVYLWSSQEEIDRHNAYEELAKKYVWKDPAFGFTFYSEAYKDKWATLDVKFEEAVVRIIVGNQPIEYIEQASKEWLAGGGEQIIKEINEAAKK